MTFNVIDIRAALVAAHKQGPEALADAITRALIESVAESDTRTATKADVEAVRRDMATKADVADVRGDMRAQRWELRYWISGAVILLLGAIKWVH